MAKSQVLLLRLCCEKKWVSNDDKKDLGYMANKKYFRFCVYV